LGDRLIPAGHVHASILALTVTDAVGTHRPRLETAVGYGH
jgi:hypothetical protein